MNKTTFSNLPIKLPPLPIQKAIAKILGDLDAKIELNRKMNESLEAMAQALFQSWFVDFDPVLDNFLVKNDNNVEALPEPLRKKGALRLEVSKKNTSEINKLFPNSFVFNAVLRKWVPEGWALKSLDEVASYQNGLALQKFRPESENDEFLPVLKISHLKQGKTDGKEKARIDINQECIVDNGDVIFSWSASLQVDLWCGGKCALNQHLFKVTSKNYSKWFYYLYTKHHLDKFISIANDKAVTMGHIKREHLREAKCLIMSKELMCSADSIFKDLIEKQIKTKLETRNLTKLRDTLLPQLMSGKLEVPEAMLEIEKVLN
jgi:type I restriction enzyme S subunit